jgi:hypothetical protein
LNAHGLEDAADLDALRNISAGCLALAAVARALLSPPANLQTVGQRVCPFRNLAAIGRNHFPIAAKPSGNQHPVTLPSIPVERTLVHVEFFSQS